MYMTRMFVPTDSEQFLPRYTAMSSTGCILMWVADDHNITIEYLWSRKRPGI